MESLYKKLPTTLLIITTIAGCGGSGGNSEASSSSPSPNPSPVTPPSNPPSDETALHRMVDLFNQYAGDYKTQGLRLVNDDLDRQILSVGCSNSPAVEGSVDDLIASGSLDIFDNGACAVDDSECNFLIENAIYTTRPDTRELISFSPNGDLASIQIGYSGGDSELSFQVEQPDSSCELNRGSASIPNFEGVYEGYFYTIGQELRESFTRSEKITLNCSNSACEPTNEVVFQTFSANGLDFTPTTTISGQYLQSGFLIDEIEYMMVGMAGDNSNTIAAIGFPTNVGSDDSFKECFDGECLMIEFHKINE